MIIAWTDQTSANLKSRRLVGIRDHSTGTGIFADVVSLGPSPDFSSESFVTTGINI
jgi:hypothetical protein